MVQRGQKPKLSNSRSKKKRSVGCWIHILYSYKSGLSFLAWGLFPLQLFERVPCSVLPDITLPSDIEGSTLDLNEEGGASSPPREEIYSSDSFRARNNLLTSQLNDIVEGISSLQRKEDPTRHRARISHLTNEKRALERELKVNQERDALRAHTIARSRELLDELRQIRRDRLSRLALFHSWSWVLIHTRECRPQ
ncbi:hypothetical protein RDABS01_012735 [Bienertia sinuspersici]